MAGEESEQDTSSHIDFSHLDEFHLGGIERQLAAGAYVELEELEKALRKHGERPIPPIVADYHRRLLAGEVRRPRGRKPPPVPLRRTRAMLVHGSYQSRLRYLEACWAHYGRPKSWTKGDPTPAEISARLVAKRFLSGEKSWRTVQNISSAYRKGQLL